MMRLFLFLLAILPLLTFADEVILIEGTVMSAGESLQTSDGACRLKLQRDGNLIAFRRGPFWSKPGISDDIEESVSWTSGGHGQGSYHARLQNSGNLQVIYHNDATQSDDVVFSTHVFAADDPSGTSHDLVFTDKCALRIMRRKDGDSQFLWTNIHEWLDNFSAYLNASPGRDNVMHKGEFFSYPGQNHGTVCGTGANFCMEVPFSLRLQHDCNLVTFVGRDHGDASAVVWSAGVKRPNFSNCYLLVDSNDVALYEGSFDPTLPLNSNRTGKYWSVPQSFFDDPVYPPGGSTYQVLINNEGQMYLDWD